MAISDDLREFVALFLSEKVEFLVVGAYAMAYHRLPRYTGDIDLFVSTKGENPGRICKAIDSFGFKQLGLTEEDFKEPDQIIQLGQPPNRIDILTGISGVSFDEAQKTAELGELEGLAVPFLSRDLLIVNKKATGRSKDLADLELLMKQNGES